MSHQSSPEKNQPADQVIPDPTIKADELRKEPLPILPPAFDDLKPHPSNQQSQFGTALETKQTKDISPSNQIIKQTQRPENDLKSEIPPSTSKQEVEETSKRSKEISDSSSESEEQESVKQENKAPRHKKIEKDPKRPTEIERKKEQQAKIHYEYEKDPTYYKTKMCPMFKNGTCNRGNKCNFAHNDDELRELPNYKKTRLCVPFTQGKCPYDSRDCKYAHGEDDLKRSVAQGQMNQQQHHNNFNHGGNYNNNYNNNSRDRQRDNHRNNRDTRDNRDHRDLRDSRDNRDNRDNRYNQNQRGDDRNNRRDYDRNNYRDQRDDDRNHRDNHQYRDDRGRHGRDQRDGRDRNEKERYRDQNAKLNEEIMKKYTVSTDIYPPHIGISDPYAINPYIGAYSNSNPPYPPYGQPPPVSDFRYGPPQPPSGPNWSYAHGQPQPQPPTSGNPPLSVPGQYPTRWEYQNPMPYNPTPYTGSYSNQPVSNFQKHFPSF